MVRVSKARTVSTCHRVSGRLWISGGALWITFWGWGKPWGYVVVGRGWPGDAGRGVRGLAQVCQKCHMVRWGDVDWLSTRCENEIWRGDAGFGGYPHVPQYYDKN